MLFRSAKLLINHSSEQHILSNTSGWKRKRRRVHQKHHKLSNNEKKSRKKLSLSRKFTLYSIYIYIYSPFNAIETLNARAELIPRNSYPEERINSLA